MTPPLRIGILLDGYTQPAWINHVLQQIQRSDYARVSLCIENGSPSLHARRGVLARLRGLQPDFLLYNFYGRLDRLLHEGGTTAFRPCDIGPLLGPCVRLLVRPTEGKFTDELSEADLQRIAAYKLDVLLRFGFRILKGGILHAARHGIWSYHHGDNRRYRGGPAGFWEVMQGDPVSGCILQVLSEELDNGRVLCRAFCRTEADSVRCNQDSVFWHSAGMLPRKLDELHRTGTVSTDEDPLNFYDQRLYTVPRNREMAGLLLRRARQAAGRWLEGATTVPSWQIGYRLGVNQSAEDLSPASFFRCRLLEPPPGRFYADPFVVPHKGRHFLFFEEFLYSRQLGRIAVAEVDEKGRSGPPRVALERPYHLSYPFVFEWQGQHYLLPETSLNRTIEVYRCRRFPDDWELHRELHADLDAVDATLHHHDDGRFYLFFATRPPGCEDYDELHVYHGDSPLGPFTPCGSGPAKCDARSARPAGPLCRIGGKLYRPAQDGTPAYGSGVVLCEVLSLSPQGYVERETTRIGAGWRPDLRGMHTLTRGGGLLAIDLLYRVPRLSSAYLQHQLTLLKERANNARLRKLQANPALPFLAAGKLWRKWIDSEGRPVGLVAHEPDRRPHSSHA